MKILCFGDSNTYGYHAGGGRIEDNYPRLLESEKYQTINEGVCGRTTNCLCSFVKAIQKPHDLTILMLGTNDLSSIGGYSIDRIIMQLEDLIVHEKEKILLLIPPYIHYECVVGWDYPEDVLDKSKELEKAMIHLAIKHHIDYLSMKDDLDIDKDGIHLSLLGHQQLANKIKTYFKQQFAY